MISFIDQTNQTYSLILPIIIRQDCEVLLVIYGQHKLSPLILITHDISVRSAASEISEVRTTPLDKGRNDLQYPCL